MKNFKKKYITLGIILLLITISLLFFKDKIREHFISPSILAGVDKQIYDAYKAFVDSYTPTWNERDCYSLFGLDKGPFECGGSNPIYKFNVKVRSLETHTSRDYTNLTTFRLYYYYDKFSACSFTHMFIFNNFTPVVFEQIKTDIYQEIDYKKIADFNCNNGNVSVVMWEQPNGTLTMLTSYMIFPDEEVPGNLTAGKDLYVNISMNQITKTTLLLNGDKFAYFNYTIAPFLGHYCNPNLPTKITFTG